MVHPRVQRCGHLEFARLPTVPSDGDTGVHHFFSGQPQRVPDDVEGSERAMLRGRGGGEGEGLSVRRTKARAKRQGPLR